MLLLSLAPPSPSPALALERGSVWITPDLDSPDMLQMFSDPQAWSRARGEIGVFKFYPPSLNPQQGGAAARNTYTALRSVDAFAKLRGWGIKTAAEAGAVKPWDCTGTTRAAPQTANHIASVAAAGGVLQLIAMDEPLVSGRHNCGLDLGETARRTAAYAAAVKSSAPARQAGAVPEIGDIEPYPSIDVPTLIAWTQALEANGLRPAFMHLDINLHFVDVHPQVDLAGDLRTLAGFFRRQGIPFGVIVWSGYAPLNSDQAFYTHAMDMARRVKAAIGQPDQMVVQSWIVRSSVACPRADASCVSQPCSAGDPPYCGKKSIPLDLPDQGAGAFSLTRLVRDAVALFNGR